MYYLSSRNGTLLGELLGPESRAAPKRGPLRVIFIFSGRQPAMTDSSENKLESQAARNAAPYQSLSIVSWRYAAYMTLRKRSKSRQWRPWSPGAHRYA